jgi:hypothetical protein
MMPDDVINPTAARLFTSRHGVPPGPGHSHRPHLLLYALRRDRTDLEFKRFGQRAGPLQTRGPTKTAITITRTQ